MAADDDYLDKRAVAREVREANAIMDRYDWRSIDVSYRAVEEIAREVILLAGIQITGAR
jgi:regulator of PEP synthase PpsR (kinase-PPPase family)